MLRRCGITPQGEYMRRHNITLKLERIWKEYDYLAPINSAVDYELFAPMLLNK